MKCGEPFDTCLVWAILAAFMKTLAPALLRFTALSIVWIIWSARASAQSNIVVNGSFEHGTTGWELTNLSIFTPPFGSVEGTNHLQHRGTQAAFAAQNLETVPGRTYVITFAGDMSSLKWDTTVLSISDEQQVGQIWRYHSATGVASTASTRLTLENGLILDDVRVTWRDEPISVVAQPDSGTGFEGGSASFVVQARGGSPMYYQWFFNDTAIVNETNSTLTLDRLRSVQAGNYSVSISNIAGVVTSTPALLNVEPRATAPILLVQPESQILPTGFAWSLRSLAVGEIPLRYQWFVGGEPVVNATNASITFSNVDQSVAGTYSVAVSNALGTVRSASATLSVVSSSQGGWLMASNNTPIRDLDGNTPLEGTRFLVQVYAGPTPDLLLPIRSPVTFRSNAFAGFFVAPRVTVPNVPAGQTAYAQIRAWDSAWGQTYEEARASGGKFGASEIRPFATRSTPNAFNLVPGFSLRAGLPFFYTGRLAQGPTLPGNVRQLVLTGAPGFRYLIEEQVPPNTWQGFLVVTNTTGTVTFSLSKTAEDFLHLFRARILD